MPKTIWERFVFSRELGIGLETIGGRFVFLGVGPNDDIAELSY